MTNNIVDDPLDEMFAELEAAELEAIRQHLIEVEEKLKALPGWRVSWIIEKTLFDYGSGRLLYK